jgi:hypothetical protein
VIVVTVAQSGGGLRCPMWTIENRPASFRCRSDERIVGRFIILSLIGRQLSG